MTNAQAAEFVEALAVQLEDAKNRTDLFLAKFPAGRTLELMEYTIVDLHNLSSELFDEADALYTAPDEEEG